MRTRPKPKEPDPPRIPRITRLMAVAIKFQDMVNRGEVRDYADLARLGYVSRARITQIMNLLNLAPEIQMQILYAENTAPRRYPLTEPQVRRVASEPLWKTQRRLWQGVRHLSTGL